LQSAAQSRVYGESGGVPFKILGGGVTVGRNKNQKIFRGI